MSQESAGPAGLQKLLARYAALGPHAAASPRCTVMPSYVLQQVALNGSERQRRAALTSLLVDDSIRARRVSAAGQRGGGVGVQGALRRGPMAAFRLQRTISDAQNRLVLPGQTVRTEGASETADVAVNEAYDGLGATHTFYTEVFERDSIDDAGMALLASVHYDEDYDNAFWDGRQMVFGDGDGETSNRFTISLDVIAHELTHGVTETESGLIYFSQSGALNESLSDVFGSLVKQYTLGQSAEEADWLIGAELLTDAVQGVALRSMAAPGTAYDDPVWGRDPQPATMSDYVQTSADYGGVHINSGIPNHAFYLAAVTLGGFAWEGVGRVWYETMVGPRMRPRMRFRQFAALTAQTAAQLFGPGSAEAEAVRNAWDQVGLPVGAMARGRAAAAGESVPVGQTVISSSRSPWFSEAAAEEAMAGAAELASRREAAEAERISEEESAASEGEEEGAQRQTPRKRTAPRKATKGTASRGRRGRRSTARG